MNQIEGFSNYDILPDGKIFNFKKGRYMSAKPCRLGYIRVWLTSDEGKRKAFSVHRLVGEIYVSGKSKIKNEINHKNGDKSDNRAENLEWADRSSNLKHAYKTGLHPSRVKELRNRAMLDLIEIGYTQREIADIFGTTQANICQVLKRTRES
jgi:hypothetical protein